MGRVEIEYDEDEEVYRANKVTFTEDDIVSYASSGKPQLRDETGKEYTPDAGADAPVETNNFGAEVCNAVLRFSEERYGEPRYCTRPKTNGEAYCHVHAGRKQLDKFHMEHFDTGAYTESYTTLLEYLDPHKKLLAVDMFDSLLDESTYDFETVYEETTLGSDKKGELQIDVRFPVAREHSARAQSLWYAALELVKIQNINEALFRDAQDEDAVGERTQVVATGEDGPVYDRGEHHLNLPLSRIQNKYKEHLKFGGVSIEGDELTINTSNTAREFKEIEPPDE